MPKEKGVKFNLQEQINPLAERNEGNEENEGNEDEEYVPMVVEANKKTKKKDRVVQQAKRVNKPPLPSKDDVKKQSKKVGERAAEAVTPDNIAEVANEGIKGVGNTIAEVIMGTKIIPESPKMETVHRMLKINYESIQEQLKQVVDYVNRCCSEKNKSPLMLQINDYDKMFESEHEKVKKERRKKYVDAAKASVKQGKRTVHRVDKDLKEKIVMVSPISDIIQRLVNPTDNIHIYETLKSIMTHIRISGDIENLSPEQDMVVADIRELIQYSNKHGDTGIKKNPPGLRLSDIIRLIFGYYIFNLKTGQVDAHISTDLVESQQFGDLRYDSMRNDSFKKAFIDMFYVLFDIAKGSMKSTLTKVLSREIPKDSIIIQRLYDRGAKKKKKTLKKKTLKKKTLKKKKKKKTIMN